MIWHVYFISKLFLVAHDRLQLDGWLNLPLSLLVYWPLARRRLRLARAVLTWPAALALVAHESGAGLSGHLWLPLSELSIISPSHALEPGLRLLEDSTLPALAAVLLLCLLLNRWLRLEVLLSLALLVFPLVSNKQHTMKLPSSRLESIRGAENHLHQTDQEEP